MVTFVKTTGISHYLDELIRHANKRLTLISPYLKINTQLRTLLEDKAELGLPIHIVYGKNKKQNNAAWWAAKPTVTTSFLKSLHAKCYVSEHAALLTSMNLYDFSQVNNHEMGVLIMAHRSPQLYNEVWVEAQRIERLAEAVSPTAKPKAPVASPGAQPRAPLCSRCGKRMTLRKAKESGHPFWGCSTFPKCWERRQYVPRG